VSSAASRTRTRRGKMLGRSLADKGEADQADAGRSQRIREVNSNDRYGTGFRVLLLAHISDVREEPLKERKQDPFADDSGCRIGLVSVSSVSSVVLHERQNVSQETRLFIVSDAGWVQRSRNPPLMVGSTVTVHRPGDFCAEDSGSGTIFGHHVLCVEDRIPPKMVPDPHPVDAHA